MLKCGRPRQTWRMCDTRCLSIATMVLVMRLNIVHTLLAYRVDSAFISLYHLKFVKNMKLHANIRNIHFSDFTEICS